MLTVLPLLFTIHDFHITHTTLLFNKDTKSIEITIKVAIEDLEKSLGRENSQKLRIGTINENKSTKKIITAYFSDRLKILINNRITKYKWVGKEIGKDFHNIYLYFEIENYNQNNIITSLSVENTIFLETVLDQNNIVLIEFEDLNYNLTFTKDHSNQSIKIKN